LHLICGDFAWRGAVCHHILRLWFSSVETLPQAVVLPDSRLPKSNGSVFAATRVEFAVGTEGDGVHGTEVALEGFDFVAGEEVELVDLEVFAAANEHWKWGEMGISGSKWSWRSSQQEFQANQRSNESPSSFYSPNLSG
jgi:hypothetical protein